MDTVVVTLEADVNHLDSRGHLRLGDLRMHGGTPFPELAGRGEPVIFLDGEDMVRGELVHDPELGWLAEVDWSTQDVRESYPRAVATG